MNKDSHLIVIPAFKPSFADYRKRYPVVVKGKTAVMYKAVHKRGDNDYFSSHDTSFSYKLGGYNHKCDPSKESSCSFGLHISHFSWAKNFGKAWPDMAILECHVPVSKIVVAKDCDGKVRTSELTIVREVPADEYDKLSNW